MTTTEYAALKAKCEEYDHHAAILKLYHEDLQKIEKFGDSGFTIGFVGWSTRLSPYADDCREIKAMLIALFKRRIEEHLAFMNAIEA